MQRAEAARCSQSENRTEISADTATECGAIEFSIGALHQPGVRSRAILATALRAKAIQRAHGAAGGHAKNCPAADIGAADIVGAAKTGGSVELAIRGLYQSVERSRAVGTIEVVQCVQRAAQSNFEDGSAAG